MHRSPSFLYFCRCALVASAAFVLGQRSLDASLPSASADQRITSADSSSEKLEVHRTKHFRIYHRNPELAEKVGTAAEQHLATITKAIAPADFRRPRLKTFKIRVYRDRQEFLANGDANSRVAVAQCVSTTELRSYELAILGALEHEIVHLVVHAYLPSMPMWIQEGFATGGYGKAAKPSSYSAAKRSIKNKSFLTMDQFVAVHSLGEARMSIDQFYLQSRMTLEFLVRARGGLARFYEFGKDVSDRFEKRMTRMKKTVRRGQKVTISVEKEVEQPVRESLASIYGYEDLAALDKDLHKWIDHRVRESAYQKKLSAKKLTANFEYDKKLESPHFVGFTTSSEKLSGQLLELSEKVYDEFAGRFWDAGILMPARMKIYIFDSGKEYAAFLNTFGMKLKYGKHLLPHYNVYADAACTFRKELTKDYLYQTVAHEVTHGLSKSLFAARTGRWVQEAIAYYVGNSVHSRTKSITLGECHETKLSRLASFVRVHASKDQLVPLAELIEPKTPLDSVLRRAQGWALFRYLEDENEQRYRAQFHEYLAAIVKTGKGGVAEFEKHVEPLSQFEPRFQEWAKTVRATSKKR